MLFTVGTIIILITFELSSPSYGLTTLTINRKKLKIAAYIVSTIFLIVIAIKLVRIIITTS